MTTTKNYYLTLLLFLLIFNGSAQPTGIQWQYSYGGSNNDAASSIKSTRDGGCIIAGHSSSADGDVTVHIGGEDFWIVKLDMNGNVEWDVSFGGSNYDVANSIIQTSDGGYTIAGYTWSTDGDIVFGSNHGMDDYWLIRLDNGGGLIWKKAFGGTGIDEAHSIIQTADTGFLIAGASSSNDYDVSGNHGGLDYWIVKTDSNGVLQWQKSYGGSDDEIATSAVQTAGGDYVIGGYTFSNDQDVSGNHGYNDYWLVKLSNTGSLLWKKAYGGSSDDREYSMIQTKDSGFALAGRSYSNDSNVTGNHGSGDYWIIKVDSAGNSQWQKSFGGSGYDEANSITQTNDNGYAIAGKSFSSDGDATKNNGGTDYWIVKTNNAGSIQWQRSVGGNSDETTPSIVQSSDSGYIVAGTSSSNAKDVSGNHGLNDYWVVKFSSSVGISQQYAQPIVNVFPNPATNQFTIYDLRFTIEKKAQIEIYNVLGENVYSLKSDPASVGVNRKSEISVDVSFLPAGLYFLRITTQYAVVEKKIVIEK